MRTLRPGGWSAWLGGRRSANACQHCDGIEEQSKCAADNRDGKEAERADGEERGDENDIDHILSIVMACPMPQRTRTHEPAAANRWSIVILPPNGRAELRAPTWIRRQNSGHWIVASSWPPTAVLRAEGVQSAHLVA